MLKIIKDGCIIEDTSLTISSLDQLKTLQLDTEKKALFFLLECWQALNETEKKQLMSKHQLGLEVLNTTEPTVFADDLAYFSMIAIPFPLFTDGRGYSLARILREQYDFKGELRAVGDVLQDQLFYMKRCGFNAFVIRSDKNIEEALSSLHDFSVTYQAATDQPLPHFRQNKMDFKTPDLGSR